MRYVAVVLLLAGIATPVSAGSDELVRAARAFLEKLSAAEHREATWPFEDEERYDVHYAPIGLDGLRHGDLGEEAHGAGESLLRAALSERGYATVGDVRELEAVLAEQESFFMRLTGLRDPGRYFWAIFGEPAADRPWAVRYEGHHLSINVTASPDGVATTPLFIGAQPRIVPDGFALAGTAVLGEEERLARALYDSFDEEQRAEATLDFQADRGSMIGQVARIEAPTPVGVARRDMNPAQQQLLDDLLERFAGIWGDEVAGPRRAEIRAARGALHFAHVEASDPPNAFYTRISAPSLLIEIDNTEGGDHVHAVWHDPSGDFGEDVLARHLEDHHHIVLAR